MPNFKGAAKKQAKLRKSKVLVENDEGTVETTEEDVQPTPPKMREPFSDGIVFAGFDTDFTPALIGSQEVDFLKIFMKEVSIDACTKCGSITDVSSFAHRGDKRLL